jgi:hypothetical protein
MVKIEQLAKAVLEGEALEARSLTQDFFRSKPRVTDIPKADVKEQSVLITSAALIELFATRLGQKAPAWTVSVGSL